MASQDINLWDYPEPEKPIPDYPERKMWCEAIYLAFFDINNNNRHAEYAKHWINETDGSFVTVASMLGLDSQLIRNRITNRKEECSC